MAVHVVCVDSCATVFFGKKLFDFPVVHPCSNGELKILALETIMLIVLQSDGLKQ